MAVKRAARLTKKTVAQLLLAEHLRELGFVGIELEHKFLKERKFSLDVAIPSRKIGFEVDGGTRGYWNKQGKWESAKGHRRGEDWDSQYEKNNLAQVFGWKVFTFANERVMDLTAKNFARNWLVKDTLEVR